MRRPFSIVTLIVAAGLLLLAAALASCAPDTSAPELQQEVAQADSADDQTQPDQADTDSTSSDTAIAVVEFTDQACLDCHTDEERLKELAVEEETGESLSEGPG